MSQMGSGSASDNITIYYDPSAGDYINPYHPKSPFNDQFNIQRATILLIFSTLGLLGNFLTILLVIVVQKLQKPHNSFFLHQCILDTVKSAYCIVFSKSLFERQAPAECAILGASYIVFVTTSAFNILAVTINEIYHFTNKVVGVQLSNKCCVLFGLGITWFASIIINLGVAFLPGNPTFDRQIGYCTFMYGVTGNYLLHVLWIILITFALLLTAVYLRKYWLDIKGRAYYRIATLFHHTMQLHFDEQNSPSVKARMHKDYITKAIQVAQKNFALLVSMIVTFVCFWYPLFALTLSDPHFRADPLYYKTLTIFAWTHSSLTPLFFVIYNLSSFKEMKDHFSVRPSKDECSSGLGGGSPAHRHLISESDSIPRSPLRPSSLNVTPVYNCENHLPSGACVATDQHPRTITRPKSMVEDRQFEHAEVFNRHRRTSLASGPLQNGYFPHNLKLPSHNTPSKKSEKPRPPLVGTFDSLWKKRNSLEKGESSESREGGKFSKMGSTRNPKHERKRNEIIGNALSSDVIRKLIERDLSPSFVQQVMDLQEKANRRSMPVLVSHRDSSDYEEFYQHPGYLNRHSQKSNQSGLLANRSSTIPDHLDLCHRLSQLEVKVDEYSPSPGLSVHRLSTGGIAVPLQLKKSMSDFHMHQHGVDWV